MITYTHSVASNLPIKTLVARRLQTNNIHTNRLVQVVANTNYHMHTINSRELGMDLHSNGSHSGSTSSMGDTERLVKVEMRDISTIVSRATQTHLSIHVGSIHINLWKETHVQDCNMYYFEGENYYLFIVL